MLEKVFLSEGILGQRESNRNGAPDVSLRVVSVHDAGFKEGMAYTQR